MLEMFSGAFILFIGVLTGYAISMSKDSSDTKE